MGGSYHADSLLYRAIGLNFVKIHPEDIESHTMQFKYNVPVMLSAYPNSQVSNNFFYDAHPHPDSKKYRKQFLLSYEYNRFWARPNWQKRVRAVVPEEYHKELLDNFD